MYEVHAPSIGELDETYQRGVRDGWRECLATTSQWSGLRADLLALKASIDALVAVFDMARGGQLVELRARRDALHNLEHEVEDLSAYWESK